MRGMDAVKGRISYAELQGMPEERRELYDGEVFVAPSPSRRHQIVLGRMFRALDSHVERAGGVTYVAPLDIVISDYTVLQPDVFYYGPANAQRLMAGDDHRYIAPAAVFEILSPSTTRNDRGRKRDLLATHGVPEYWVIDPDANRIELSRLQTG